jgi:hypothetical protein
MALSAAMSPPWAKARSPTLQASASLPAAAAAMAWRIAPTVKALRFGLDAINLFD